MPLYDFMAEDGRIIEVAQPMSSAGKIGTVVEVWDRHAPGGGRLVKATKLPPKLGGVQDDNWKPYVSDTLPRHLEGVACTANGKPIITSKAQERDICAKFGYVRD